MLLQGSSFGRRDMSRRIMGRPAQGRARFGVGTTAADNSGAAAHRIPEAAPRVLLFSSRPRSDAGGVQAVMEAIESELGQRRIPRLRIGPDEQDTPWTHRLWLTSPADVAGRRRLEPRTLPRAAVSLARLAQVIARFRPDVVNVHFACNALEYFLLLRRIFGYRLILSLHGSDLLHPHPGLRPQLPGFLREADAVTVVSCTLAHVAEKTAGPRGDIRVLPNGVDTQFWSPGGAAEKNRIVAAGRLEHVKGFDVLIEAVSGIPGACLDIYGDGRERTALERLAQERGADDRLRLPGRADRDTLRRAYREAAVFAMPSRSEGMPLALLEAMACGVPPVASAVGEVPQIVSAEAGWLVPPEDADGLRIALAAALAEDAPDRGRAARERVEHFSAALMVERYLALYGDATKPDGARGP
jgi:glycosyltransferase involved in cell wall biosynthesis